MPAASTTSIIHQRTAHGPATRSNRVRTKTMQVCVCLYNMSCAGWYVSFFDRVPQSWLTDVVPRPNFDKTKFRHGPNPIQTETEPFRKAAAQTLKCGTDSRPSSKQQASWRSLRMARMPRYLFEKSTAVANVASRWLQVLYGTLQFERPLAMPPTCRPGGNRKF